MPTAPPTVTPLPTPVPSRDDPANFPTRGDVFLAAIPTFQEETSAVAANVYANAVEAEASATAADVSKTAAAASASASATSAAASATSAAASAAAAGATLWVSGTTYTAGAVVYSPVSFLTYRRRTTGAGTTDPSADATNWALASAVVPGKTSTITSTLTLAVSGVYHVDTTAGAFSVSMPPSPVANNWVLLRDIGRYCGRNNLTLARNGSNFYNQARDYVMNVSGETVLFVFDSVQGWVRG